MLIKHRHVFSELVPIYYREDALIYNKNELASHQSLKPWFTKSIISYNEINNFILEQIQNKLVNLEKLKSKFAKSISPDSILHKHELVFA